ncbi:MAG: hypothetical protein E2O87_05010 [Bacteroidetes bacterium]|nr:MAG: hypothetical protein E2O87_05010 [Bacteroidota bacterium]
MFERLKRRSLKKVTERNLAHRDLSQLNSTLKTLGFIVDEKLIQDFEPLYDFYVEFKLLPKDVKVFTFIEVKKKLPSLLQNQVQSKDFNWKGEMHNQNASEFLDKDFDVLVGYYEGKHEFLDAMISQSNAKFKVGFAGGDKRLFDLLISVKPNEIETFKLELKKYLEILKKL